MQTTADMLSACDTTTDQRELMTVGWGPLLPAMSGDKPSTSTMEDDGINLSTKDWKPTASQLRGQWQIPTRNSTAAGSI